MNMTGMILQILVTMTSLTIGWLLSQKGKEHWGYFLGWASLPVWVILEWYYSQYLFLSLNVVYFYIWFKGWLNHR